MCDWQLRIYSSQLGLIAEKIIHFSLYFSPLQVSQRKQIFRYYLGLTGALSVLLCRMVHIYFTKLVLLAHTCDGKHLTAATANESKPQGNSRGRFKSGIFNLDKRLTFSYIPLLPSCFNCMNEGHLK